MNRHLTKNNDNTWFTDEMAIQEYEAIKARNKCEEIKAHTARTLSGLLRMHNGNLNAVYSAVFNPSNEIMDKDNPISQAAYMRLITVLTTLRDLGVTTLEVKTE